MSWLSALGNIIQKPQSALAGGLLGIVRDFSPGQEFMPGFHDKATTPWQGIMEGLRSPIHPHDLVPTGDNQDILSRGINQVLDIGIDPLLLAGPAVKAGALGETAADLGTKALSAGHLTEDATKGEKLATMLARGARRTVQGTLATGDPLTGFGWGALQGLGENFIANKLPTAVAAAMKSAPEVADSLENVPSAIRLNPADFFDTGDAIAGPAKAPIQGVYDLLGRAEVPATSSTLNIPAMNGARDMSALIDNTMSPPVGPLSPGNGPNLVYDLAEKGPVSKPETVTDLIDKMYGKGRNVKYSNQDDLAQAFLSVLRGR